MLGVLGVPRTREGQAIVNGVRLHYVEAGAGPLVLLLHGFPEFWYTWRHQLPALAAAGFHAVAPDMRGYNTSEKPPGVGAYRIEALVGDVAALIRHFGPGPAAALVGHDWGGVVAWYVGMLRPQQIDRLVVLNAPHPAVYRREVGRLGQALRSWYVAAAQLPWLPELALRLDDYALLRRLFRLSGARPGAYTAADVERTVRAMAEPGALRAALNYYRAAWRRGPGRAGRDSRPVERPVLLIWGDRDVALGPGLTRGLTAWAPCLRVEHFPDASHWVQHDARQEVNDLLIAFARRPPSAVARIAR